jgi:hypothetical protein
VSDSEIDCRIAVALHVHVPLGPHVRRAIMDRVRALPAQARPSRPAVVDRSRSIRHSIAGMALAAGVGSMATLPSVILSHGDASSGRATAVIGDTVSSTLHDTLRLVRLIFRDTAAHRVAAIGDFNAWQLDSTPLRRDGTTDRWTATVALRDGVHRYAFVVDGVRWAVDPAVTPVRDIDGRTYSRLTVTGTTN